MCAEPLILGKLTDFITGEILPDTIDERARQALACFLVEKKHFAKDDIRVRCPIRVQAADQSAERIIDFIIGADGKTGMILQYGPGSITSRHRPALAASRMAEAYQIPVVVVTNGKEADILDGVSGNVIASGLDAIPSMAELREIMQTHAFDIISPRQKSLEARILYAFEVNDSCFCDSASCPR